MNLVVRGGMIELHWQRPPDLSILESEPGPGERVLDCRMVVMGSEPLDGLLDDQVPERPAVVLIVRMIAPEDEEGPEPLVDRSGARMEIIDLPSEHHVFKCAEVAPVLPRNVHASKTTGRG